MMIFDYQACIYYNQIHQRRSSNASKIWKTKEIKMFTNAIKILIEQKHKIIPFTSKPESKSTKLRYCLIEFDNNKQC